MANNLSEPVEKIVNNFLKRLKSHLKGLPEQDQEELIKEIHSHIYESFINDKTENEIDRILNVLNKLGEPTDVISSRMSDAMVSMGKKKKLPLYILAGILIALFGLPVGIGGIAVLFAIVVTIVVLILSYYIMAFSLVISGWLGMIASLIRLIDPNFLVEYIHIYPQISDPRIAAVVGFVSSIVIAAGGIGMFWLGKHMMKGIKFLFNITIERAKESRRRPKLQYR